MIKNKTFLGDIAGDGAEDSAEVDRIADRSCALRELRFGQRNINDVGRSEGKENCLTIEDKIRRPPLRENKKKRRRQAKERINYYEDEEMFEWDLEEMFESEQQLSFQCHLCGEKKISRSQLYTHYSTAHYKEELMSLVDRESLQCPFCGWKRNKMELLIPHLGSAHDRVEDYLPPQFHLPRSKAKKYSKISSVSKTKTTHDLQNENKETESNEKSVQTLMDEENEREVLAV